MSVGEISDGTGGESWTVGEGEGREGGGGLVFGGSDAVVDALGLGSCLISLERKALYWYLLFGMI